MPENFKAKKTKGFRSLTVTLSATFLLLTLAILFVTSGLETYLSFKTQQKSIADQERLIAQGAVDAVKVYIQDKFNMLETAVRLGYLNSLSPTKSSLDKLLSLEPAFRQLVLLDSEKRELLRVSRVSRIISSELIEFDAGEVFSKLEEEETYISPVYIDKVTNEPIIVMVVPMKNVFGDTEGVIIAEVNLKFMWDLVSRLKVGEKGFAYVVDRRGRLIAFKDVSRVLKEENLASLEKVSEFIRGAKESNKVYTRGILGTNAVSDYATLNKPDWAVVVELPVTEAYAGVIYQAQFTILFAVLIIILGAVLGVYLSRIIAKPIINLRNAAEKISKGKFNTRASIKSNNEIGELASDFNHMAEEIQTRNRKLSEGLGRMQSLVESVKLGVIMIDLSLNVILANSAANKMLGKPISQKISFRDLSKKIKSEIDISQALSYYVHTGTPFNIQEVMIGKSYVRLFMSPVRDIVDKIFIGAVVVMEDITEQKKLDNMRREIVSITSHQLRTPSTIIKGNLEMLMSKDMGKLNGQQEEILNDIYHGNERMIRLINDLMDVAKIDEGKFSLVSKPVQLEDIVGEVIKVLMPLAKERKVALEYHKPEESLPPVKINAERVTQVLQNTIDNALKYSGGQSKGKVEVEIREGAKHLEVVVKDNGIGIPVTEQGKIFERFSRGSNSTKLDPGGGSGLGLYIAKAVVEQGGGRIWFESEENKGTTFHTTYPYH